jgi:4-amino-4-deoxy-L-arabinose transferase-like glycosyltransferase
MPEPAEQLAEARPRHIRRALALWLAVVAVTGAAAALRFDRLGAQSLWVDEVVTWNLLHRSLGSLVTRGIPGSESTPPLYYLVAWGWVRLAGWSEAGIRSLSALCGTLTVPVVYLATRTLVTVRAGLVAAALVAASPLLAWYSQEARSYALFVFLSALSLLFLARLLRRHATPDLAAWSAVCALALATHYFALFLVAAEAVLLGLRLPRRRFAAALAAPAAVCLLLAPLVYEQRAHARGLAAATPLGARLAETVRWFATGGLRSLPAAAIVAAAAAAALALLAVAPARERRAGLVALTLAGAAGLAPVVLAVAGKDYVFFRNLVALWLPLAIALAAGLAGRRLFGLGLAAAFALIAVFVFADVAMWTRSSLQRDDYRRLAASLPRGRGIAFVVYPGWDATALRHYDPALGRLAARRLRVRAVDIVGVSSGFGAWKRPDRLRLAPPAGWRPAAPVRLQHFLLLRFVAPRAEAVSSARLVRVVHAHGVHVPAAALLVRR